MFDAPQPIAEIAPSSLNPVVTADGLSMYFSQHDPSTNDDIVVSVRPNPSAPWGPPSVVAGVNTSATDRPGWVSQDRCRLYLTRNVASDTNIFVATRR